MDARIREHDSIKKRGIVLEYTVRGKHQSRTCLTMPTDVGRLNSPLSEQRLSATALRVLALVAALLWVGALIAPVQFMAVVIAGLHLASSDSGRGNGYSLALIGWLGPLVLSVAWYANIPFAIGVFRMARGRPPGAQLWRVAACLAATSLLPHLFFSMVWGPVLMFHWGPALWLWLAAIALLVVPEIRADHLHHPKDLLPV